MAMAKPIYGVKELPRFPAVSRDIAIVVKETAARRRHARLHRKGRRQDAGRGAPVRRLPAAKSSGEGKKSVAYALTFRACDRTLTDAEIQASMDKILKALETNFGRGNPQVTACGAGRRALPPRRERIQKCKSAHGP